MVGTERQTVSPWMDFRETCEYGRFKEKTLRDYVYKKKLPVHKRGKSILFARADIDAFMAACRREAT